MCIPTLHPDPRSTHHKPDVAPVTFIPTVTDRCLPLLVLVPLLLVFGAGDAAFAQQDAPPEESRDNGRVTGRVLAADTGDPLAGATVEVRAPSDSSLVTGVVTDESGRFTVSGLPYGTYTVRVRFVGFVTARYTDVRLTRTRPERNLEKIELAQETEQLQEVTVSAQRPAVEIQTDRTVYNTDQQLVTAGGSARTVLNDLPSIQVDLDGSISFRGSEGVRVHVNGEPTSLSGQSLASFLESLPASAVERVEHFEHRPETESGRRMERRHHGRRRHAGVRHRLGQRRLPDRRLALLYQLRLSAGGGRRERGPLPAKLYDTSLGSARGESPLL